MKEFINIHVHTNLGSMLDALADVDDLFDKVKELGHRALAITDHGTLAAHYDAFQAYKRTGVKFIPGVEAYFVHSHEFLPNKEGDRGRKRVEKGKHLVMLAKNEIGYKNLLLTNFIGFERQILLMGRVFPRVSWDVLEKHSEGLICTSACVNGILSNFILNDQYDEAYKAAQRLSNIYTEGFYIEIQPLDLKDERIDQHFLNQQLISIAQKLGIPLVVGIDVHYITRESEKYHDMLMAVKEKAAVDDPDRFRYGTDELYVKTGDEIYEFLSTHYGDSVATEAMSNTIKIAEMCEPPDYMEMKENHLPIFKPNLESDYEEFLNWRKKAKMVGSLKEDIEFMRFRVFKGIKEKLGDLSNDERKNILSRIKNELSVLEGNNFSSYMLIVSDFIKWAKSNDILVGFGRGCLTKDALVMTSDSFKRLDSIKEGDLVLTHNGRYRMVRETFKYKVDEELVKFHTDYSFDPITLTKDHKVYAVKASRTDRYNKSLQNGWVAPFKGKKYKINHNPTFITASDLDKEDFIFMPFPTRDKSDICDLDLAEYIGSNDVVKNDEIISKIPLSNNMAIRKISKKTGLARETIQRAKRKSEKSLLSTKNVLSKYLNTCGTTLEKWQNSENVEVRKIKRYLLCDEEFCYVAGRWIGDGWISDKYNTYNIGIAFHRNDYAGKSRVLNYFQSLGFKCGIVAHKERQLDQLYVYSHIVAKLFRDLFPEYENCSSTKSFGMLKWLPYEKSLQIILGIKHSDGHYNANHKDQRESIDSTSLQLIKDIREELLFLKIPSSVITRKEHCHSKYLCKKSYKIRFRGIESSASRQNIDRIFDNGYYVKILKKESAHDDYVYDIHVDEDNSYVTQNYAVHNSVGGSLVAYLLDIHGVNPIEYGLLFERFQNAYKSDLPDIDTDFTSAGRDAVQEYCRNKYGTDHCAHVSNINTYTPKNVIPDLVKSMRNVMPGLIPEGQYYVKVSDAIKETIPDQDSKGKKVKTLERAIEISPKLKEFSDGCPELMEYADQLIGLPKEYSTHAAGMVISDIPIIEFAPLRIDKNGSIAVQYEKNRCESIGLVKMDFLAISTLDVIHETFKNIKNLGIMDGPKTMEDIPLDDSATYNMIQNGHTKCVFQLGKSSMMVSLCKLIKPKNIVDIAMVNALGRPSSSKEERQEYALRRFGKKKVEYLHPSLESSLKETYGLGVFEEQLMGVAQDVAGWDLNKADGLRKLTKLKGKNPELALQLEVEFIKGTMEKHNMDYEKAKEIWDKVVLPFAGYGFNKSHAVFYSINGYITAYLKCHYPSAFLAAYLKIKTVKGGINKEGEIAMAKGECKRIGVSIIPPDVNRSGAGYEVLDERNIVMGFSAVKGLGIKAVDEIVAGQPYDIFVDFIRKTQGRVINKSKMEALAKAGCFDSMDISRKDIHDLGKKTRDRFNIWVKKNIIDGTIHDGYNVTKMKDEFPLKFTGNEWGKQEKLRHERDVLGELVSGSLNDLFPGFFTGISATPISRLKTLPDRYDIIVEFLVLELLREFKIKSGRYSGQKMIKYRVSDNDGAETELTVWPSEYNTAKKLMVIGRPIRAQCQVSEFNGDKTIMLRSIEKVYGM